MAEEDSFQVRVVNATKGTYHNCMRRSLQTVALYEANRCLTNRYSTLRPFQRKIALIATAIDLIKSLDFLDDYHCQEIMFRTQASREPLDAHSAWKRMRQISREINETILPKAKEVIENEDNMEKSHDEICDALLQSMFEESTKKSKPHHPMWEYNHNHVFLAYRIYYRGVNVDPNLFPATPLRYVEVPIVKPENTQQARIITASGGDGAPSIPLANMTMNSHVEITDEERRAILKEVKDHTELLKEFEGVISEEELSKRKRALYAALPPVPLPASGGKVQRKKAKSAATPNTASTARKEVDEPEVCVRLDVDGDEENPAAENSVEG